MKKSHNLFILIILFISNLSIAQTVLFYQSPLTVIGNHSDKKVSIGFTYNYSLQIIETSFHYPEIEIQYHFFKNISCFGSVNYNRFKSKKHIILGRNDIIHNKNYGYSIGIAYLNTTTFWFLTNYEIIGGFSKNNIYSTIENTGSYYQNHLKTIEENYNELYIQFNFLKATQKNTQTISIKASTLTFNKLINSNVINEVSNYITDNNFQINSPFRFSIAYAISHSINKRLFYKTQIGISLLYPKLKIGKAPWGWDYIGDLFNFNLSVGLVYHL